MAIVNSVESARLVAKVENDFGGRLSVPHLKLRENPTKPMNGWYNCFVKTYIEMLESSGLIVADILPSGFWRNCVAFLLLCPCLSNGEIMAAATGLEVGRGELSAFASTFNVDAHSLNNIVI
jgi:hypothetical protein